jgi:hypothetical protein
VGFIKANLLAAILASKDNPIALDILAIKNSIDFLGILAAGIEPDERGINLALRHHVLPVTFVDMLWALYVATLVNVR